MSPGEWDPRGPLCFPGVIQNQILNLWKERNPNQGAALATRSCGKRRGNSWLLQLFAFLPPFKIIIIIILFPPSFFKLPEEPPRFGEEKPERHQAWNTSGRLTLSYFSSLLPLRNDIFSFSIFIYLFILNQTAPQRDSGGLRKRSKEKKKASFDLRFEVSRNVFFQLMDKQPSWRWGRREVELLNFNWGKTPAPCGSARSHLWEINSWRKKKKKGKKPLEILARLL